MADAETKTNTPQEKILSQNAQTTKDTILLLRDGLAKRIDLQCNRQQERLDIAIARPIIQPVASFSAHPVLDMIMTPRASQTGQTNQSGDSLLSIRNGYERLSDIAQEIAQTQIILNRGMRAANSSMANAYYSGASRLLRIVGVDYQVPNLRETVNLQMQHMHEYSICINEIIGQTQSELKKTHSYVFTLGNELHKLEGAKNLFAETMNTLSPAALLQQLQQSIEEPTERNAFLSTHDQRISTILAQGDHSVAQRAIARKKEYLLHSYAVELLLLGSLATAKKIAVDTCSYASMLERISSSYFTLGCSAEQLGNILAGLESMQRFTDSMQTSVANALQRLDGAILSRRTSVGNGLERAIYSRKS